MKTKNSNVKCVVVGALAPAGMATPGKVYPLRKTRNGQMVIDWDNGETSYVWSKYPDENGHFDIMWETIVIGKFVEC